MDDQMLNHFMQNLSPMVIGIVLIIASAWVIGVVVTAFKDKSNLKTRADLYNRLMDKFGSASEFVDYLQSETGRQFFEELPVNNPSPIQKILKSIQIGIILTLLGIGLLVLGNIFGESLGGDLYIVLTVSGTIALMIGVGFLISTGISYYLSKSLGLLSPNEKPGKDTQINNK
jgi:hypothetical protein